MHRLLLRLLSLALALAVSLPAAAQFTRDKAANKKVDEAVNVHYLATDFDKAEAVLLGTIKACEDKCSPQTLARAWMYVGLVRGSGRGDQKSAATAFQNALALDPNVQLDAGLATPETQGTFQKAGGTQSGAAPPAAAGGDEEGEAGTADEGEGLSCTPDVPEVETRRPIPVECTTDEDATQMELRYKPFGSDGWKSLSMAKHGDGFRAQIPCDATQMAGSIKLYVRAKDAGGDSVGNYGSKSAPVEIQLVEESAAEPPSYPDAEPPARCAAKEICPPDFPGCESDKPSGGSVDWGGSCSNSTDCKTGLLCVDGTCETAPSCDSDADCSIGKCIDGKCHVDSGTPDKPYSQNWIGIHGAQDFALVSGENVCTQQIQADQSFACYEAGSVERSLTQEPYPGAGIGSGTAVGTQRILVSYDRALTPNLLAGVRLGYALGGGPPLGRKVTYAASTGMDVPAIQRVDDEGKPFMPFHAEARASYWFGQNALVRSGLRFYAHVGGGMAQVDARVRVPVKDCGWYADYNTGSAAYASCVAGTLNTSDPRLVSSEIDFDVWKKLGLGFATVGGGIVYAFSQNAGLQLNLNLMYMLPVSGIVVEPSAGLVFGL